MNVSIHNRVPNRIQQFYDNAMLKYPNTYFSDNADKDIDKVRGELYKVGTQLLNKKNHGITKWNNYQVDFSQNTGWYFAYTVKNNAVFVYDAENYRNMSNNAHPFQNQNNANNTQQNNQQKQIQYQPVSNKECFGMTMVKSNNGLFNFINKNKQFFLKQWYKSAKDFAKYNNGVVAGQVFDGSVWWWVYLDRPMEQIKNNTIPENKQKKGKIYIISERQAKMLYKMNLNEIANSKLKELLTKKNKKLC